MTEQLPEQKQRGIYEWFYLRLKQHPQWVLIREAMHITCAEWHSADDPMGREEQCLVDLYMPDGKEDYNFVWECIEKLEQEHVRVMYDTADHLWYFWFLDNKGAGAVIKNLGFWFALSELLEGE